ncbi:hypothetical protein ACHAWT_003438 [Skeletonema menzelii]
MSFSNVPCPPYYSVPTHDHHPHFAQGTYVRQYNDWYECLIEPYCNSPTFLGYNPPGTGEKWQEAWRKLDEGAFPCNPNLETSDGSSSSNSNNNNSNNNNSNNPLFNNPFSLTNKPTSRPTTIKETPSLISGSIWYDANGDGLKNTIQNALTTADREAASKERGSGVGNMKVTLRNCNNDATLGVTYSFPRQSTSSSSTSTSAINNGESGASGGVQIVDTEYLDGITQQQQFQLNNDGDLSSILGFGNVDNTLGYYSFRVLPSYLPGNFYVVFEAPEGYRLTAGSGEYWEVQEAEANDVVQPVLEADWKKKSDDNDDGNRQLQETDTSSGVGFDNTTIMNDENNDSNNTASSNNNNNNNNFNLDIPIIPSAPSSPDKMKLEQINHSGYYARSKNCIYIKESPTTITNVNYGLTKDSWPLNSFQYASFVIMIEFFEPVTRQRELQAVDSLECRKYQKLKGEGVDIEDIWGCETPLDIGGGARFEFTELTIEQADLVVASITDFLLLRAPRAWSIKNVHLAWQEVVEFNTDDGRDLLDNNNNNRALQNQQLAQLELGIRIRAEFESDKAKTQDLADVVMASIDANPTTLLSTMKANVNVMPPYFRLAGGLSLRRIAWKPPTPSPTPVPKIDVFPGGDTLIVDPPTSPPVPEIGRGQMMMIIGIVTALVLLFAGAGIAVGVYMWRKRKAEILQRKRQGMPFDGYDDEDSLSSRWYSDYEGSDRGEDEVDDLTDYAEEDSFGDFDPTKLESMRESMRASFKASQQNKSMRSSFQSQRSGSQRESMRDSMQSSARSSMRSQSSARLSMQSSGRSSASMRSTAMASMRSAAMSSRSMRSSTRSMHSAAMSSRSMRSSGISSRGLSGDYSSAKSSMNSELGPIT